MFFAFFYGVVLFYRDFQLKVHPFNLHWNPQINAFLYKLLTKFVESIVHHFIFPCRPRLSKKVISLLRRRNSVSSLIRSDMNELCRPIGRNISNKLYGMKLCEVCISYNKNPRHCESYFISCMHVSRCYVFFSRGFVESLTVVHIACADRCAQK